MFNIYSFVPKGDLVVYNDEFQVITWNKCATFNVYFQLEEDEFKNVDCFTVFGIADQKEAVEAANDHAESNNLILEAKGYVSPNKKKRALAA